MRRWRVILGTLLVAAACACTAQAELNQQGSLVVRFDGGLQPNRLPRHRPAPIAVTVGGDVKSTQPGRLPQLRRISVAINRSGRFYDRGLPICRVESIQPSTEAAARRICGEAIVGHGEVTVLARIENQQPFTVRAKLLAFNGPRRGGAKLILAQVYSQDPPGAFVLSFEMRKREGLYGTVMSATLPRKAWGWAYLTHFSMTLHRVYTDHGRRRSLLSAACAAPAGFPGAVFPFAKATYGFDNGQEVTTTIVRGCKVRG